MNTCDVLIFAEDPGAANVLAGLPSALEAIGITSSVISCGLASEQFKVRGTSSRHLSAAELDAQSLIEANKPSAIICGTAENLQSVSLSLFVEGKSRGIATVGVVDMLVNADRRFRGTGSNPFDFAPDYIMVPDSETRSAFQLLGFPADKLVVTGYPHFDHVLSVRAKLEKLDQSKLKQDLFRTIDDTRPIVVFVAEPASTINPSLSTKTLSYSMSGRGSSTFRTAIVLEETLDAIKAAGLDAFFVLRLHPKNDPLQFSAYEGEIDYLSSGGDPLQVLWVADLVIGMTSMLLQEAAWLGKNSLAVLPDSAEKSRLASIACGLTPAVGSRSELVSALNRFRAGSMLAGDVHQFFTSGASSRMAQCLQSLIRQRASH